MTFSRIHYTAFLAIAVIAWSATLLIGGDQLSFAYLAPFGTVVSVLAIAGVALEHVLWKQRWLRGWFIRRPNISGTWHIVLRSDWINPETGLGMPPIQCYLGVKQTLSTLQMHLMTPESESWLLAHSISEAPSGEGYQIAGVYRNEPGIALRDARSPIHRGALILTTHGDKRYFPSSMEGEYWTDRKTTGHMEATRRLKGICTRYAEAEGAFVAQGPAAR